MTVFCTTLPKHRSKLILSLISLISVIVFQSNLYSQTVCANFPVTTNTWTWVKGSSTWGGSPNYGTRLLPDPANTPGPREGSCTWKDTEGHLWLFGGYGLGYYNDLWQYDITTNNWTWIRGKNGTGQFGVYSTQNESNPDNTPGARSGGASWVDSSGNFWLFGGYGLGATTSGYLNDLWKFSPSTREWTWIGGASKSNDSGNYWNKGVPNTSAWPGSRSHGATWIDSDNNVWLYGGITASQEFGDLWKYNITSGMWTWVQGSSYVPEQQSPVWGEQRQENAENTPGARAHTATWIDEAGNLWLFGGQINSNYRNDMWRYNTATGHWAWFHGSTAPNQYPTYGVQGEYSPDNTPGAIARSNTWSDGSGKMWLFGGNGYLSPALSDPFNSRSNCIWNFDPATNEWMWVKGRSTPNDEFGYYGTQGLPDPYNTPKSKSRAMSWVDNDNLLWIYGASNQSDLWKYGVQVNDITITATDEDTSVSLTPAVLDPEGNGSITVIEMPGHGMAENAGGTTNTIQYTPESNWYGTDRFVVGVSSGECAMTTSAVYVVVNPVNDAPNIYSYIATPPSGFIDEAVKFSISAHDVDDWNLVRTYNYGDGSPEDSLGSHAYNHPGTYTVIGTVTDSKVSTSATLTVDIAYRCPSFTYQSWTLLRNAGGPVYGTKGLPAAANTPGSRTNGISWKGSDGKFWLYGGNFTNQSMCDMWQYDSDFELWTWMAGSSAVSQAGVYVTKGIENPDGTPGGRSGSVGWTGTDGNLWLYGGSGRGSDEYSGFVEDLWKYNVTTRNWTWVMGTGTVTAEPVYGTSGQLNPANTPGSIEEGTGWVDNNGNLWLFAKSDLWKFDINQKQWAWIKGTKGQQTGRYGTVQVPNPLNMPGYRDGAVSWTDQQGHFWLFGGTYFNTGTWNEIKFNDLWKFDVDTGNWTWMKGSAGSAGPAVYGLRGVEDTLNTPGGRESGMTWRDTQGNLWIYGGFATTITGPNTGVLQTCNDLWRYNIETGNWSCLDDSQLTNQPSYSELIRVPGSRNTPGSRFNAMHWVDDTGNIYLYGGNLKTSRMGDLWKYRVHEILTVNEDTSITVSLPPVTNSNNVTATELTPASLNGVADFVAGTTDTIVFVPDLDFNGMATIFYNTLNSSCETSIAISVHVLPVNDPPRIENLNVPEYIIVGQETTFSYTAVDPEGDSMSVEYDYGDSSMPDESGIHIYTSPGTFPVTLKVSDGELESTMTAEIVVHVTARIENYYDY